MAKRKVLIVDDDEDILRLVEKRLSLDGFEVMKVSRGREVLSRVGEFRPQLILMDIMMDDMDGAEVVRQLQADKIASAIPVIFLSGIVVSDDGSREASVKVGDRKYPAIPKPFSGEELLTAIRKLI